MERFQPESLDELQAWRKAVLTAVEAQCRDQSLWPKIETENHIRRSLRWLHRVVFEFCPESLTKIERQSDANRSAEEFSGDLAIVHELNRWRFHRLYGQTQTSFSSMLFELIQKADPQERIMLSVAFPSHVAAYQEWLETGEAIFRRYHLPESLGLASNCFENRF